MSNTKTLYNAIIAQGAHVSFHTPGHKFNCRETVLPALSDTTEISVTDELYHPFGPVEIAEKEAAETFGTASACFSAGGATLCIQTALSFYAGKRVLTERHCHISVINAAALLGIDLDFVWGDTHEVMGFALPVTAKKVEEALSRTHYSALVITSPNYYGLCADLKDIKDVCIKYGTDLIIDNSHGSHLSFMYPRDARRDAQEYGDFTVNSLHKTLPVMTGGALLCANKDIPKEKIKQHMAMFASTSPSFAILASLDYGVAWIAENRAEYLKTAKKVDALAEDIRSHGFYIVDNRDGEALRLCIDTYSAGYTAEEIAEILEKENIFPEIAQDNRLLFLFSPFNEDRDIKALSDTLCSLPIKEPMTMQTTVITPAPEKRMSVRDAILAETEYVPSESAEGRISAETFATCPPGMAVVVSGEEITHSAAKVLARHKKYTEVVK